MFKLLRISIIASLFLTACKKQEVPGPKGDPGTPGGGGNSNVSSSTVFSVKSSDWKRDSVEMCWRIILDFPSITKEVVDSGAVKVFIKDGTTWAELPFTAGDLFTEFGFETGKVHLKYINIEGPISFEAPAETFRILIYSEAK